MAIANGDTPDWIQKHNEQTAEQARKAAAAEEQRQSARASVQTGGPDFWTRLVDRIIVNVRALPGLAGEELVGSVSPSTGAPEYACHIQVNRQSVRLDPELSKMNLWYTPGGGRVRCWYQDQPLSDFTLGVHGGKVAASINGSIYDAEKLADQIVEWMADRVKASRSRRAS